MQIRPRRVQVVTEIGQTQSLPAGPQNFDRLGRGRKKLFLGLGPEPGKLAEYFPSVKDTLYVECPEFERQMPEEWHASIPADFKRIAPEDVTPALARSCTVRRYLRNIRFFPSFWGPLWATCALPHLENVPPPNADSAPVLWLPGDESDLLDQELNLAFRAEGFSVLRPQAGEQPTDMEIPWRLTKERPRVFFSVNFKGLDRFGELFHLLRRAGTRVAIWCVDNPFHLLTGVKSRYWTQADLFVTDDWFIEPLKQLGAQSVHHLPLAAAPALFKDRQAPVASNLDDRLVFVGRSEFPHKREFFAGVESAANDWPDALAMLERGERPDFAWWTQRLEVDPFWPNNAIRQAGFMAEETGAHWRAECLRHAGERLTVFGDDNWRTLLDRGVDVRPPVDYYGALGSVYARARACLNMTSPLLPHGLTQRHFDVWAVGGLLLTDTTPGLDIFPPELVREITFSHPEEIQELFERISPDTTRATLGKAWSELILAEHTYTQRVRRVLNVLDI